VPAADATADAGADSEAADARRPPDPASFDCRSLPDLPARVSSTPVACGTDPACLTRQVAGHRGAGGQLGKLAPEDTLAAYRAAIAIGADYGETDPRPTKDGVLVNVHDTTVDRTTTGTGTVDQMTLAEVQALTLEAGSFSGDFSCERIPTLRQVLETCVGRLHVLVDANKTDRVDLLVGDIVAAGALDWAIFDTSSVSKIQQALALEPALHVMIRVSTVQELDAALGALGPTKPAIVEIHDGGDLKSLSAAIHARGLRALTDGFGQDVSANLGGPVSVYGQLFDVGIDIVQSDRPELVLELLGRR
jgi:glycerophosphoryl diester phosphodiesterase